MYQVLLVEDNQMNQLVAAATLDKLGYEVERADDGAEAIDACMHRQFDAVLMDIQMPVMDGYQATAKIREHEVTTGHRTPIIGLSARAMDGDRETAIAAGLDDYLTKPLRKEELREKLERWIIASPLVVSGGVSAAGPSL
jgi:CheY-like chemotaxis protein